MEDTLKREPTAEEAVEIQKAIEHELAEIKRIREIMRRDQKRIEASQVRTDANLKEIDAALARLRASYNA